MHEARPLGKEEGLLTLRKVACLDGEEASALKQSISFLMAYLRSSEQPLTDLRNPSISGKGNGKLESGCFAEAATAKHNRWDTKLDQSVFC